jgi:hypothetical protein
MTETTKATTAKTEAATDEKAEKQFKHPEIVAMARSAKGFRRSGIFFPGDVKTIVPANSLSEERYNAVINEPQLVALERPTADHKADAIEAVIPTAEDDVIRNLNNGPEFILGGSKENATETMLNSLDEGVPMGHPSLGSTTPHGVPGNVALDQNLVHDAAEAKATKATKVAKATSKTK